MYKIAICEDDERYIEILEKMILMTSVVDTKLFQFFEFSSGEQLFIHPHVDFDMVIMDMQMGKMDGYETAMELRKTDRDFLLVFCSGVLKPVPKHFKAGAYRYLEKENSDEEMLAELNDIVSEMVKRKERPYLMCKYSSGRDQIRIYPESILYIAIKGTGCQIFAYGKIKEKFPKEILRTTMNLNSIAEVFNEEYGFARIHNSYIVNMSYITHISKASVRLVEGTELNVARSKIRYFQQAFAQFGVSKY